MKIEIVFFGTIHQMETESQTNFCVKQACLVVTQLISMFANVRSMLDQVSILNESSVATILCQCLKLGSHYQIVCLDIMLTG